MVIRKVTLGCQNHLKSIFNILPQSAGLLCNNLFPQRHPFPRVITQICVERALELRVWPVVDMNITYQRWSLEHTALCVPIEKLQVLCKSVSCLG